MVIENMVLSFFKTRMKKMIRMIVVACILSVTIIFDICAGCTIGVIDGSVTCTGRPILWKTRDVTKVHNSAMYFEAVPSNRNEFEYDRDPGGHVCIVSTFSYPETNAWAGINEAGFAILNSIIPGDYEENGTFMKLALERCASVDEFEQFLCEWEEGGLADNFGVMDASGNAALFEVQAFPGETPEYYRFDAAGEEDGFVVRTNFSMSWEEGTGRTRYERACELLRNRLTGNRFIDAEYVLQVVVRDIDGERYPGHEEWDTYYGISRYLTRSCAVIEGARADEDPPLGTFWVILGEPSCGIAVPLWVCTGEVPQQLNDPGEIAPLNELIIEKEMHCYPDNSSSTMNTTRLYLDWDDYKAIQSYTLQAERNIFFARSRLFHGIAQPLLNDAEPPLEKHQVIWRLSRFQSLAAQYVCNCLLDEDACSWNSEVPSRIESRTRDRKGNPAKAME
jgi:hypothetical protein